MDIKLDFGRAQRIGFSEAVYCEGKNVDQLNRILDQAAQRAAGLLLTRLSDDKLAALAAGHRAAIDFDPASRTGFFAEPHALNAEGASVAVITAGTSDTPVGRETARTLRFYGEDALEIGDVGVAGLWRLLERADEIARMRVVIVCAGMDGALPSVVGGLVPGLVIAVPTSVGYGVCDGGRTALHAALASCAPGLLTVNIDNGYGAACAALRALNAARRGDGRAP